MLRGAVVCLALQFTRATSLALENTMLLKSSCFTYCAEHVYLLFDESRIQSVGVDKTIYYLDAFFENMPVCEGEGRSAAPALGVGRPVAVLRWEEVDHPQLSFGATSTVVCVWRLNSHRSRPPRSWCAFGHRSGPSRPW